MDIKLGIIALTNNQISQLPTLRKPHIKGFSVWNESGETVVVTDRDLSETEIEKLKKDISELPDTQYESLEENDKKSKKLKVKNALKTLGLTNADLEVAFGL